MSEISGGGYQYPKAVLDAVGKRYLVEHWESDDGLTWYDKYSDGWVEQGGKIPAVGGTTNVPLLIEMSDKNYTIFTTQYQDIDRGWADNFLVSSVTTTSFDVRTAGAASSFENNSVYWSAKGFAV